MTSPIPPHKPFVLRHAALFLLLIGVVASSTTSYYFLLKNSRYRNIPQRVTLPYTEQKKVQNLLPTDIPVPTKKALATADWKLFINPSFSFRYPDTFVATEEAVPKLRAYPFFYSVVSVKGPTGTIILTAAKNTPNYTLTNLIGNGPYVQYNAKDISGAYTRPVAIDDVTGTRIDNLVAGITSEVLVIADKRVYQILLLPQYVDTSEFDALLQTLRLLSEETPLEIESWQQYVNQHYGYQFLYPQMYAAEEIKQATTGAQLTQVYDNSRVQFIPAKLKIEVQDIKSVSDSAKLSRDLLKLPLKDYVEQKWQMNKNATQEASLTPKLGEITIATISGKRAYQFTVGTNYVDDLGSEKLNEDYLFVFTEHKEYKIKIWYPKSEDLFGKILTTLLWL